MKEQENFPFLGNKKRYEMWEKEPVEVVSSIDGAEKELGVSLPESLQKVEGKEITPEKSIDIDNRALQNKDCPNIVFGRPHGGEYIPSELWKNLSEDGKKTLPIIDRGTSEIFKSENISSVGTKISRFVVDPNRPPLPGIKMSKSKAPGEVLWKKSLSGADMFDEGAAPSSDEIRNLSEKFYLPYYNAMMATIGSLADRRESNQERVLIIDGHSFPISEDKDFEPIWEHYEITPEELKKLPLFIIGDMEGGSCDTDIVGAFSDSLEKNFNELTDEEKNLLLENSETKELIGKNKPFKGARNVEFFGQRKEGINSFQLELNESAFVDEDGSYYDSEYNMKKIKIMKKLIEKTCLDIDPILKGK